MTLVQLKYFQAVGNYHSVSAAAEVLHISQPSISAAIRELEDEFGVRLFFRQHRGMALTPEGSEFMKLSTDLLRHAEQVHQAMFDLGDQRKVLQLGLPPVIGSLLLPRIYQDFIAEAADMELRVTEAGREELLELLASDRLDLLVLPHMALFDGSLSSVLIGELETVCCVSDHSALAELDSICAADLTDKPLVLFDNSFFQTESIKKRFAVAGIQPNVLLETTQLPTLQQLISSDAAAGFLFRQLVAPDSGLRTIPLDPPMTVQVSLVWKRGAHIYQNMSRFIQYITQLSKEDPLNRQA